jgi:hypothetical protein
MDLVIEFLKLALPYFLLSIGAVAVIKMYLISKMKRFDLAEVLFSFFRLYNMDERNMSSNRKRISYMKWNNLLNYYVYFIIGFSVLIYFVTKNT